MGHSLGSIVLYDLLTPVRLHEAVTRLGADETPREPPSSLSMVQKVIVDLSVLTDLGGWPISRETGPGRRS